MKPRLILAVVAIQAVAGVAAAWGGWLRPEVSVGVEITGVRDFYEPLGAYGEWVDVSSYGQCWRPLNVADDWRPYCDGYWTWTDDGWFWVSYEPFGWACYHYGRWVYDSNYGWLWVPDTTWGPSWVSWRDGGGYVGWAPLPPGCDFGPDGFILGSRLIIESSWFVFVEHRHFCEPIHRRGVIVNNTTLINQTVNITKIRRFNHAIINDGPNVEVIQRATGRRVHTTPVNEIWSGRVPRPVAPPDAPPVMVQVPSQIPPARTGRWMRDNRDNEPTGHGLLPRPAAPVPVIPPVPLPPPPPLPAAGEPPRHYRPAIEPRIVTIPDRPAPPAVEPPPAHHRIVVPPVPPPSDNRGYFPGGRGNFMPPSGPPPQSPPGPMRKYEGRGGPGGTLTPGGDPSGPPSPPDDRRGRDR